MHSSAKDGVWKAGRDNLEVGAGGREVLDSLSSKESPGTG